MQKRKRTETYDFRILAMKIFLLDLLELFQLNRSHANAENAPCANSDAIPKALASLVLMNKIKYIVERYCRDQQCVAEFQECLRLMNLDVDVRSIYEKKLNAK